LPRGLVVGGKCLSLGGCGGPLLHVVDLLLGGVVFLFFCRSLHYLSLFRSLGFGWRVVFCWGLVASSRGRPFSWKSFPDTFSDRIFDDFPSLQVPLSPFLRNSPSAFYLSCRATQSKKKAEKFRACSAG